VQVSTVMLYFKCHKNHYRNCRFFHLYY